MAPTNSGEAATVQTALEANMSPRSRSIHKLEQYVETTQYEGRQDWFASGLGAVPLLERRPCIAYPMVKAAIDSNVDLCLGEGRYPAVTVTPDGDTEDEADGLSISSDQAQAVDRVLTQIEKVGRLKRVFREAFAHAQAAGSVPLIVGLDGRGVPYVHVERAKWSTPEFDARGNVTRLEIRYPYVETYRDERDGQWHQRAKLYRRVIDAQRDVTYHPADADVHGREPAWIEDKARTFAHGLGFCPVVWYAFMKGCVPVNVYDGRAIHARCLDEIWALDVALSQRHRAAIFSADPQIWETGVDQSSASKPMGRTATGIPKDGALVALDPLAPGGKVKLAVDYRDPTPAPAKRKGPGEIWSYESPDAKVGLLTLPGDALKVSFDNASDLRLKLSEALGVVFLDPESIKFAATVSAKAIGFVMKRQLDRCDQYRDDMADGMIIPTIQMLLRVCASRPGQVTRVLPGIRSIYPVLPQLIDGVTKLTLRWGAYFASEPADEKALVDLSRAAKDAGLVTTRLALQKIARTFGVENIDSVLEEIEDEAEEAMARQQRAVETQAHALANAANGPSVGTRGGRAAAAGDEESPASSRSDVPASAPARSAGAADKPQSRSRG